MKMVLVTKKSPDRQFQLLGPGRHRGGDGRGRHFDEHVRDTLMAGAGLCDEAAVRRVVEGGPTRCAG
jgi:succinate dehydrogenase/fumarate reductase flavoprotein subunit